MASSPAGAAAPAAAELEELAAKLRAATDAMRARRELRAANAAPARPSDAALSRLDASMKKNTALLRKLRAGVGDGAHAALLDDVARVNQSKYVSEAVAALAEAPLRPRDVPAAAAVAAALHQRYPDFGAGLAAALAAAAGAPPARDGAPEDERAAALRRRAAARLLAELVATGVAPAPAPLLALARDLAAASHERDPDGALAALVLLGAVAKAGREELLGMPPPPPAPLEAGAAAAAAAPEAAAALAAAADEYRAEAAQRWALPAAPRGQLRASLDAALDAAAAALQAAHEAVGAAAKAEKRALASRGDVPEAMAARHAATRAHFEALQRGAAALSEALDRPLPPLRAVPAHAPAAPRVAGAAADAPPPLFDDEESATLYLSLPDMRAVVPAVLLRGAEADGGAEAPAPAAAAAPAAAPPPPAAGARSVDAVLARLPACGDRDTADALALEFCHVASATRGSRRRLARALLEPPPGGAGQLPFYARVAAVLAGGDPPVFPDIAAAVVAAVDAELRDGGRGAGRTTAEARVRCARYAGELVKFSLLPPERAFAALAGMFDDFWGPAVDAACALVESAGRFLSRRADAAERMAAMLGIMLRLKEAKKLDARAAQLVDSAVLVVRAPRGGLGGPPAKERPPVRAYVRHVLLERLAAPDDAPAAVRALRKLPWGAEGADLARYVATTLLRAGVEGRAAAAPAAARVAAGVSRFHPEVGVGLADAVLEEVAAALERPEAAAYQRRLAAVRLLAELHAERLVAAPAVFSTLHLLLLPPAEPRLDPPASLFRARLAAALLGGCGPALARGAARARLDAFLPYLSRSLLAKPQPLPLDVELDLEELWDRLGVRPPRYASLADACAAVAAAEARAAAAAAAGLAPIAEDEEDGEGEAAGAGADDMDEDEDAEAASEDGSEGDSGDEEEEDDEEEEEESAFSSSGTSSGGSSSDDDDEAASDSDSAASARSDRGGGVDEEFDRELAALMGAMAVGGGAGGGTSGASGGPAPPAGRAAAPPPARATVALKVMLRRGGREERTAADLHIPVAPAVAAAMRAREEAQAAEKAQLKRLVLQADRTLQEEEAGAGAAAAAQRRRGGGGRR